MKEIIISCSCGCCLLRSSNFEGDPNYYFAMFNYKYGKMGLWKRIHMALKVLRTGKGYSDQMILEPEELDKLRKFLVDSEFSEKFGETFERMYAENHKKMNAFFFLQMAKHLVDGGNNQLTVTFDSNVRDKRYSLKGSLDITLIGDRDDSIETDLSLNL